MLCISIHNVGRTIKEEVEQTEYEKKKNNPHADHGHDVMLLRILLSY